MAAYTAGRLTDLEWTRITSGLIRE